MNIVFRQHAVKRMHERGISEEEVEQVIADGTVIENYPNDQPYPSALLLGHAGSKAIHLVCADAVAENLKIIITVYEPDSAIWCNGLRTRRKP